MSEDQFQKLMDEFRQATIEWGRAAEAAKFFVVLEPLSDSKDIELKPPAYYEQMKTAYEKEQAARENYFAVYQALSEYQQSRNIP
jgi:hypothetical protein